MKQDVVDHAAQRVKGIVAGEGILTCLADGHPQAAGAIGVLGQYFAPDLGVLARACHTLSPPGLHHHAAIRFLVIADLDHIDLAFEPD